MKIKLSILFIVLCSFAKAQTMAGSLGHSLFICNDGTASSCGYNPDGQLGDGTTTNSSNFVQVTGISAITAVATGIAYSHSLFLKNDSTVWACGLNENAQLGNGTLSSSVVPVQVSGLTKVIAIAAGESHSLFLKSDSTVWACGNNSKGQLGAPASVIIQNIPAQIASLSGIVAIAAGFKHSLFLKSDGTVWACGDNTNGQVGDGTFANQKNVPVQVSGMSGIVAVSSGGASSLFLKNDGTVWACGFNGGELGTGSGSDVHLSSQVIGLTDITAVSAGAVFFLYLKSDSTVWACGSNVSGQLGDGTTTGKTTAYQIPSLSGVKAIEAGGYHSLFEKYDGTVWGCGYNAYGQLGTGSTTNALIPVALTGLCSTTAVAENAKGETVSVYPNPFSSETTFHIGKNKNAVLVVYNSSGQKVREIKNNSAHDLTLQRGDLQRGLYFYLLTEEGKAGKSGKLVITD